MLDNNRKCEFFINFDFGWPTEPPEFEPSYDFVKWDICQLIPGTEVRLTPTSFNAAIGFDSQLIGIGGSVGVAAQITSAVPPKADILTAFGLTNQNNIPVEPLAGPFGMTQDVNNRMNVTFEKVSVSE